MCQKWLFWRHCITFRKKFFSPSPFPLTFSHVDNTLLHNFSLIWSSNIGYSRINNFPRPSKLVKHHTGPCIGYELSLTRGGKAQSSHRALRVARKHITNKLESLDLGSSVPWSLFRAASVARMGCVGSFNLSPVTKPADCTCKHIASHKTGYSAMLR